MDYKPDGTTDDTREAGLGKERKLGLKRVGDTHLKPKSWVGAGDCCGTGAWTREGREAWITNETARGRHRKGSWTREGTETWTNEGG